jgi:hypothetical protein
MMPDFSTDWPRAQIRPDQDENIDKNEKII